jgi:hypothetical protein
VVGNIAFSSPTNADEKQKRGRAMTRGPFCFL